MISRLLQKDIAAGALCLGVAAFGLVTNSAYRVGTASAMGPGYFPTIIFGLLGLCGAALIVYRLVQAGDRLDAWAWRPLLTISGALVLFGLVVDSLGYFITVVLMLLLAGVSSPGLSYRQLAVVAFAASAVTGILFVEILGLQIRLWPRLF